APPPPSAAPPPEPRPIPAAKSFSVQADQMLAALVERMRLWSPVRTLSWILGFAGLVIVALTVGHFRKVHSVSALVAVHIGTNPAGATLRIDSQAVNISNQQVNLKPGDHDIEASLPGYETATAHVSVKPGAPSTVELTLLPLGQALRITAPDLDAGEASLDDKSVGQLESGALALSNISAGDHVLKISAPQPAQEDATILFRVAPGE